MRRKAFVLVLVTFIIVAGIGAFWYSKSQTVLAGLEGSFTQELTRAVGSNIAISKVELTSYNKVTLYDVTVMDSHGELIASGDKIEAVFSPMAIIRGEKAVAAVQELAMDMPRIYLTRRANGSWNIDELLERTKSEESSFSGKITIRNGSVTVKVPQGQWLLENIAGGLDFVHKPDMRVDFTAMYGGAPAKLAGKINKTGPSVLDATVAGMALDDLRPLVPAEFALKSPGGKIVNLELTVKLDRSELSYAGEVKLDGVAVDIADIPVRDARGLVTFTEKSIHFFGTTAKVLNQDIQVRGRITTNTTEPVLDLNLAAKNFDLAAVVKDTPVVGPLDFTAAVTGTPSRPSAYGEVRLAQGEAAGYAVSGAVARFNLDGNTITVSQFDAGMFGGRVAGTGSIDIANKKFRGIIRGRGLDMVTLPWLSGELSGRGDVDFSLDGAGVASADDAFGTVKMDTGTFSGVPFIGLTGGFAKTGDHIAINYLTVNFGPGVLTAQGSIDNGALNLAVFGQGVPLANLAAPVKGLNMTGLADGEGTITGTTSDPRFTGRFTAYNGQAFNQPFTMAKGSLDASRQMVTLTDVEAVSGVTRHSVQGAISLSGQREMDITIITSQARAENIVKLVMPTENLTGNVDNQVRITGPMDDFTAEGKVKLTEGSFRGQLFDRAEGRYLRRSGITEMKDFTVEFLNTKINFAGTFAAGNQLDIDITARDVDIAALRYNYPYPVAGRANFTGKLTGTSTIPVLSGEVTANNLLLNNQELQAISGTISMNGSQIDIPSFGFSQKEGKFSFAGGINIASGMVYGSLNAENGNMASLLAIINVPVKDVDGRLDGHVGLQGTMAKPNIQLTGTLSKGKIKNYPLDNIEVDIALENNVVTVNRFYAKQGSGILVARGTANLKGPLDLEVGGRDIDAGLLTTWFDSTIDTRGKLNFTAQITGTSVSPHAAVSLEIKGGGVANATFDALYGLLILDKGSIHVNQLMLTKGPYRASAYGTIPLAALSKQGREQATIADQMDLKVRLEQANLSILPLVTKEVAWAVGETTGEVTVSGTLAQPLLYGDITIKNGTVKLASLTDPIQKVGVDIHFEGDKINIKTFDGSMGAGGYRLTGTATLHGLTLEDYNILLVLDKLGVNHKYFKGPLNGTLTLASVGGKPSLSGKIILENTTANIPYAPEFAASDLNMGIDLELLVQNKVRLFNPYMYDVWVEGRVKFAGTTQEPLASGRINAIRGTVNYLRTQFKVKSGSIEFTQYGSLVPVVRLKAETRLEHTKVTLSANGPLNQVDFHLASEPVMNQQEILSLLTLRSQNSSGARDNGLGRDEIVGMLSAGLQMRFLAEAESAFRGYFGLDDFRLVRGTQSSDSRTTDREVYSLEISKYVNDRLLLSYTMGVDHKETKASFRYDINRRLSITGEKDEFNQRRFGVETRFNF